MKNLSETLTFTLPLGSNAHALAKQFWRQQSDSQKAKQVYLNTLAVYAVNFYLNCMGIKTNWSASYSCNSIRQILADVADLEIPHVGLLECRPVLPKMQAIDIPPEAWSDRIGYVAVQLDESLRMATLLGFSETAGTGELAVEQLQSLEDLLAHLTAKTSQSTICIPRQEPGNEPQEPGNEPQEPGNEPQEPGNEPQEPGNEPQEPGNEPRQEPGNEPKIQLSQWLENIFEIGWQSIETILGAEQQNLAFSLRSNSHSLNSSIKRAKLIDLGLQLGNRSLALLVAITPETEQKVGILVQLHPMEGETYLPPNLKLSMLSESGEILQEVESRSVDNYIQMKRFRGLPGESFAIQLTFGEVSVTEDFVI
ncbi:DUF1822 family protein [Microseira wollei]|uniref:DUF1822 family protein n=1 Tax=Microseira wollei NIES-4236 TaxID=2530354 RepID=A0AAV3WQ73_9CYAN|nr:DUF1822 family protein [Microseira wollei]GET44334.1 hypothetical protein MiSe_91600 [Microseira wollei NIES-4236]